MKYLRTLTRSEVNRHFIHIDYVHRADFPPTDKKFKIQYQGREIECRIDKKNRMWLGHGSTVDWKSGAVLEIQKHSDILFSIH